VYLVRWRREFCFLTTGWSGVRVEGKQLVRLFSTCAAAEAFIEEMDKGRIPPPPGANPFLSFSEDYYGDGWFGAFESLSEMPEPIFADFVRDLGLEPPQESEVKPSLAEPFVGRDWGAWWQENAPTMTDAQRAQIWGVLNHLWFFEVIPVPLHDPA
jgi:hypothetical protein